MGKCHLKKNWLLKTDSAGYKISTWARKHSDSELFCIACSSTVNVAKGFQAITQHYNGGKHKENVRLKFGPRQMHLVAADPLSKSSTDSEPTKSKEGSSNTLKLCMIQDVATTAELIWAMKTVCCNFSAASCDGIRDTFSAMFPGCIPEEFSLSRKKLSYIITEALAPHFRKQVIEEAQLAFYVLAFDETTNSAGRKELQMQIRFWSNSKNEVVSQHLETFFLSQATGNILFQHLCTALDNAQLPYQNLINLSCDGPNVNKTVFRLMNEDILKLRKKRLLDIGSCNPHVIHNAFQKGLQHLGEDASEFVLLMYYFFKGWPVRFEYFNKIQEELGLPAHHFIKHVLSRWLTLESAASRLIEQWDAIVKYFLKHVPMKQASLLNSKSYQKIVKYLKEPTIKAELCFVVSSSHMFTRFTGIFQRNEPLIHVLYGSLKSLVQTLLGRICTPEALKINILQSTLLDDPQNLTSVKQIVCNEEVEKELAKVTEKERIAFRMKVLKHYISACKHILQKTQLGSIPFLQYFKCLKPEERKSKQSCSDIVKLSQALPCNVGVDDILDEWKLLQLEEEPPSTVGGQLMGIRIDHYWQHFFKLSNTVSGGPKYPSVTRLLKACLAISHGSADVERGFSLSGRVLSDDRASMNVRTLNARLTVADGLKMFHNKPEFVPITKQLLILAQGAANSYKSYLEQKKKEEHEKQQKKKKMKKEEWKKIN